MPTQRLHHVIVLFVMVMAVGCKTNPKLTEDASTSLADAAAGDAAVEVAALDASPPAPPPPVVHHGGRDLEEQPPPQAKSPIPTSWTDAEDLVVHGRSDCSAVLKREWVRMTCPNAASAALLGGSVDGVMVDIHEPPPDPHSAENFGQPQRNVTGIPIFPVRRGDRRLLQFNQFQQGVMNGYQSSPDSISAGPVVSEVWLDGEKGPRLEAD